MKKISIGIAFFIFIALVIVYLSYKPRDPDSLSIKTDQDPIKIRKLPKDADVNYFGKLNDGRFFVIYRHEDTYSYADFKVYIGTAERLEPVPLVHMNRDRCGGTTTVRIPEGTFFFPVLLGNCQSPDAKNSFQNEPIAMMFSNPNRLHTE